LAKYFFSNNLIYNKLVVFTHVKMEEFAYQKAEISHAAVSTVSLVKYVLLKE